MGCWNETCMLTNLPILGGDEIAVLFLACREPKLDTCYPDGVFVPIAPALFGEYNEYGNVENVAHPDTVGAILMEQSWSHRLGYGPGDYGITPWSLITKNPKVFIYELIEIIRDHPVYISDKESGSNIETRLPVHVAFIRKEFYDYAQECEKDTEFPFPVANDIMFQIRQVGTVRSNTVLQRLDDELHLKPLIRLQQFMNKQRISYRPSTGTGSQAGVSEVQLNFYRKILKTAETLYHKYN